MSLKACSGGLIHGLEVQCRAKVDASAALFARPHELNSVAIRLGIEERAGSLILSRHRRFIFFKTIKTGGTSCEIVLSRFCGPKDVITYLPPPDERLRRSLGGRPEQNNRDAFHKRLAGRLLGWERGKQKRRFDHNISAIELRAQIPEQEWHSFLKFTVARNPFDRAISKYFHDRHQNASLEIVPGSQPSKDDINEYLQTLPDRDLTNWHIYADDKVSLVDRIMRYENLSEEIASLLRSLGIAEEIALPRAKGAWRTNREPYRSIIGTELRRKIEAVASNEFELMCYKW
ncbi:sulfotransferase family 2 domain-containing protein [Mesorhizobium australicum]|uniref:sulfotransferase family 2 domain-containing protein n=1 Tax=Mesorhizobium australicum TaxID=536018 RepID=UPI003335125F